LCSALVFDRAKGLLFVVTLRVFVVCCLFPFGAGVPKGTGVWQTHQDFVLIQTQSQTYFFLCVPIY
jgi:hypothetical protein